MTEQERLAETMMEKTPAVILRAVRRIAGRSHKKKPNWVLAMDIYCVGRTFAHMICTSSGIDPDATN